MIKRDLNSFNYTFSEHVICFTYPRAPVWVYSLNINRRNQKVGANPGLRLIMTSQWQSSLSPLILANIIEDH